MACQIKKGGYSMNVWEAIATRRSLGQLDGVVDDATIQRLIEEGAIWAPNHHHTEPWHFTVLKGESRGRIGLEWAALAADELGLGGDIREKFEAKEQAKLLRAPVIIVVSQKVAGNPVQVEEDHAAVGAAVQNLLLAAHAIGLGTRWRTGKMAYHPWFKHALGLGADDRVVALIYVGWPVNREPELAAQRSKEGLIDWITE